MLKDTITRKKSWDFKDVVIKIALFVFIVALWEGIVRGLDISYTVFPTVSSVGVNLFNNLVDGTFLNHFFVTFIESFTGFIIGSLSGIVLGIIMAEIYWAKKLFYPYILAIQAVPVIALAPLFLIWFGFGMVSKIAMTITIVFFPVLVNTVTGIESANKSQIKLLKAYAASRWKILYRVKLPSSLPYIFAGLRIAIVLSVVGAVVSELIGSNAGLGYLINIYNNQLNMSSQFAVLIILAILSVSLIAMIQVISRKVFFWK